MSDEHREAVMSNLKPCPHCGGEAEYREGSSTARYIRCKKCGCRTGSSRDIAKLAEAWNDRRERTCRDSYDGREFGCSECGAVAHLLIRDEAGEWQRATPVRCPACDAKVVNE